MSLNAFRELKMSRKILHPTKQELEELYINQHLSCKDISSRLNIGTTTVNRLLKKFGIIARRFGSGKLPKNFVKPTKEELEDLYWNKYWSAKKIADFYKVDRNTMINWIKNQGIKYRAVDQARLPKGTEKPSKELLEKLYLQDKLSSPQIAKKYKVSKRIVLKWLSDFDILRRTSSSAKLEVKGIILPTKEELENDLKSLSLELIAKNYKVSVQAIVSLKKRYGLQGRNWSEARKLGLNIGRIKSWNKGLSIEDERVAKLVKNLHEKQLKKLQETRIKLSTTLKKLHSEGKIKTWNKGLTKEMDSRIAKSSERLRLLRIGSIPWNKQKIPDKEELIHYYVEKSYSLEDIAEIYKSNPSTVSDWLKHHGIQARKSLYGRKERLICKDGHKVRSSYEKRVCNWLSKHSIFHKYEPCYLTEDGKKIEVMPDFLIVSPDYEKFCFIEIWGLSGVKKYDEKIIRKRKWYQTRNWRLLEIYPKDKISEKLNFLLQEFKYPPEFESNAPENFNLNLLKPKKINGERIFGRGKNSK